MVANLKRMMQSRSSLARTTKKPRKPRTTRRAKMPRLTIPTSLLNLLLTNKKCLIFSTNFNTMSAFFFTNRLPASK